MPRNVPEFIDRINNPQAYPYIERENGEISTHEMAAEQDEDGNWIVFPTIAQLPSGELYEFKTEEYYKPPLKEPFRSNRPAMEYALRTGNFLPMKSKEEALKYAEGGYKKGTPLENKDGKLKQFIDSYRK